MGNRSNLVTTRTGLTIGCAYQAPPPRMGSEAENIQAALLSKRGQPFERVLDWIDRNAPRAYLLMAVAGVVFGLVVRWMR